MAPSTKSKTTTTNAMATLSLSLALLVGAAAAAATASANSQGLPASIANANANGSTITFPLIPHHAQRMRRGLSARDELEEDRPQRRRRRMNENSHSNSNSHSNKVDLNSIISTDPQVLGAGSLYMGYGTHYVDLWVGTPPQRQTVIVDTGSSQTAFPCGGCEDCGSPKYHIDSYFEESESSTFAPFACDECSQKATCDEGADRCAIEQYYSEGSSWEAYEAMDTCYVGGFHNSAVSLEEPGSTADDLDPRHAAALGFPLRFGCQTKVTGLFQTQLADGILGMCDGKSAFWHQMYRAKRATSKQFSLCYSKQPHPSREGTMAGAMTLGGSDTRLHDQNNPMVFTTTVGTSSELPRTQKSGYFDVHIRKVYIRAGSGGESATTADPDAVVLELIDSQAINEDGGVIVDSGTTDTYFSKLLKPLLLRGYHSLTNGLKYGHDKIDLTETELANLPTIIIQMAGDEALNKAVADAHGGPDEVNGLAGYLDPEHPLDVLLAVPPSHYMERLSNGQYQNRFYATETDGTVLGANAMMGHDILFDPDHNRLGWVESSCDYGGLTNHFGYPDVLADEVVTVETEEMIEEEEEEEGAQEDLKETFDEEEVETEIEKEEEEADNETPDDDDEWVVTGTLAPTEGEEDDWQGEEDDEMEWEPKSSSQWSLSDWSQKHNFDLPIDDLQKTWTENPAFYWGGLAVGAILLFGVGYCLSKCCCSACFGGASRKNRRGYRRAPAERELRSSRLPPKSSYKDQVEEEDDDSNYDSDNSDTDSLADEYGDVI